MGIAEISKRDNKINEYGVMEITINLIMCVI